MKKLLLLLLLSATLLLLQSCNGCKSSNKILTSHNIVILSDMTDRIEPKINGSIPNQQYPPKDLKEINNLIDYFKNDCVKPGQKIGDRSSIFFSTFSNEIYYRIDLGKIESVGERQKFIHSTGHYEGKGLEKELEILKQKAQYAYSNIQSKGMDLISVLIDKIENKSIIKEDNFKVFKNDSTFFNYNNDIYIFTDGYLEYYGKSKNSQFYFGEDEINKIREYCILNNVDINTALEKNPSLKLKPIKNKLHENINLHILETHERDKNVHLQTYKHPIGQRDNEILEAVWRKWAEESGFKSLHWKKY